MQPLGCFARPVIQHHPGGHPVEEEVVVVVGDEKGSGASETPLSVHSLSATHLYWYAVASVPALYLD